MDSSDLYRKMCVKATEIQALRPVGERYQEGDMVFRFESPDYRETFWTMGLWRREPDSEDGYEAWLPRLDQLCEMMVSRMWHLYCDPLITQLKYVTMVSSGKIFESDTPEQAMLQAVMYAKHSRRWTGEGWE